MKPDLYLENDNNHIAIYTKGNKNKQPVIILHGGPGGHISENNFIFFNENDYFLIAFDQRGCGNSKPFGVLENNNVFSSISDIEMIRRHFNLKNVIIFGGSYGSTLALAYAINYPEYIKALVLRGIFLGRQEDIDWLYQSGASFYYPEEYNEFKNFLPSSDHHDIVNGYYKIFTSKNEDKKRLACKAWSTWESSVVCLNKRVINPTITNNDISLALLECYYFKDGMFSDDNYILNNCDKIKDIETYIVHGRYDIDCRPIGAYLLKEKLNKCELYYQIAGHTPYDEKNTERLIEIMERLSYK